AEILSDGSIYTYYRADGIIGSIDQSGNDLYYIQNNHGDVVNIYDLYGSSKKDYAYTPYGKEKPVKLNVGTDSPFILQWHAETNKIHNPFRYAGEYQDLCSGLIYLRNRYYDPSIGRFISEDPIKDGLNWYVYCNNNPVMFVDPMGLWAADGSDERFKENNPIVYQAIADLSETWSYLDELDKNNIDNNIDIQKMKKEVSELANKVRNIGDLQKVKEPFGISAKLNSVEQVLYASNPALGNGAIVAGVESRIATEELYGDGYVVNDNSDAFRHAYWHATSTLMNKSEYATDWANAHEYGFPENFTSNNIMGTYMDLYNNGVGIYQGAKIWQGSGDVNICKIIRNRVDVGGLFRIIDGKLVVTDSSGRKK
ncbi:MAG: RHS repeat-associated core domain-containing protein, partial [Clostridia bacterium]|nr:RHS repeat-associated core domain-containing protein [Clostridia bacterium]